MTLMFLSVTTLVQTHGKLQLYHRQPAIYASPQLKAEMKSMQVEAGRMKTLLGINRI